MFLHVRPPLDAVDCSVILFALLRVAISLYTSIVILAAVLTWQQSGAASTEHRAAAAAAAVIATNRVGICKYTRRGGGSTRLVNHLVAHVSTPPTMWVIACTACLVRVPGLAGLCHPVLTSTFSLGHSPPNSAQALRGI
jgi:hypothetical protein